MIKKIPSNQVIVTPNAQSNVKLDELNRIIKEMETGEAAINRLREIDNSTGLVTPAVKRKAEAEFKRLQERKTQQPEPLLASVDGALDDKSLAMNMLSQAKRMESEAKGMIAEAARMKKDAQRMYPAVKLSNSAPVVQEQAQPTTAATRRGRPPRVKVVSADAVQ